MVKIFFSSARHSPNLKKGQKWVPLSLLALSDVLSFESLLHSDMIYMYSHPHCTKNMTKIHGAAFFFAVKQEMASTSLFLSMALTCLCILMALTSHCLRMESTSPCPPMALTALINHCMALTNSCPRVESPSPRPKMAIPPSPWPFKPAGLAYPVGTNSNVAGLSPA